MTFCPFKGSRCSSTRLQLHIESGGPNLEEKDILFFSGLTYERRRIPESETVMGKVGDALGSALDSAQDAGELCKNLKLIFVQFSFSEQKESPPAWNNLVHHPDDRERKTKSSGEHCVGVRSRKTI